MKRYIVVILVLCLSGIPSMLGVLKANEHVTKEEDGREYRWHRHKPTYFVGRNGVFFDGRPIKDASPSGFLVTVMLLTTGMYTIEEMSWLKRHCR